MLRMSNGTMEAQSVAEEIKRIIEYSGGLITYKDIAVLVRMNYLSRSFETSLNSLNIPYVVVSRANEKKKIELDLSSFLLGIHIETNKISIYCLDWWCQIF